MSETRERLKCPATTLQGVGKVPAAVDEKKAARVFYVAARRAIRGLVMEVRGRGSLAGSLHCE